MDHPKDVGDRTTLAVVMALQERGFQVFIPFGENTRYDLVIDDGTILERVQCKTGRLRSGAIVFKTCSSYAHHSNPASRARDYHGEVDCFGVYCPETHGVYLVPIAELPSRFNASLRVEPARNAQTKRIRTADDYLVGTVAVKAEPDATSGA